VQCTLASRPLGHVVSAMRSRLALRLFFKPRKIGRAFTDWLFVVGSIRCSLKESPIRLAGWKGRFGGTRSGAEMGPASKKDSGLGTDPVESPVRLGGLVGTHWWDSKRSGHEASQHKNSMLHY
jgi:hypothetical protein